jgi:hypothetical protein
MCTYSLLVDTYKRYKLATAVVVTWLVASAAKVSNIDHVLVQSRRLNGKAQAVTWVSHINKFSATP